MKIYLPRRKEEQNLHKAWLIVAATSIAMSCYAIYTVRQIQSVASGIEQEMLERQRARRAIPLPFGTGN